MLVGNVPTGYTTESSAPPIFVSRQRSRRKHSTASPRELTPRMIKGTSARRYLSASPFICVS